MTLTPTEMSRRIEDISIAKFVIKKLDWIEEFLIWVSFIFPMAARKSTLLCFLFIFVFK